MSIIRSIVGFNFNFGDLKPKRGISFRKPKTPKTFRDNYDDEIDKIDKKYSERGTPVDKTEVVFQEDISKFIKLISRNKSKADRCWSKKSRSKSYICAYKYATAGYLCDLVRNCKLAGALYHFAGHQFRHIEEYELSGKFYTWSAEAFKETGKELYNNAVRSYRRAQKAFEYVGDEEIAQKIKILEEHIDSDQANLEQEGLELISWFKNRGKLKI